MKKLLALSIFIILMCLSFTVYARMDAEPRYLFLDGKDITSKEHPITFINDMHYVPLSHIVKEMGYELKYNLSSKTVYLDGKKYSAGTAFIKEGANATQIYDSKIGYAYIDNGEIMVPVDYLNTFRMHRTIAEKLESKIPAGKNLEKLLLNIEITSFSYNDIPVFNIDFVSKELLDSSVKSGKPITSEALYNTVNSSDSVKNVEWLVKPIYESINSSFNEGYTFAETSDFVKIKDYDFTIYKSIDTKGNIKDLSPYQIVRGYSNGYYMAVEGGGSANVYYFLNPDKKTLLPIGYKRGTLEPFSDGLAKVADQAAYGYVDKTGAMVIDMGDVMNNGGKYSLSDWTAFNSFHDGLARIRVKSGKYGFIDKKGNIAIEPQFTTASDFENGYSAVSYSIDNQSVYNIIDTKGNKIFNENLKSELKNVKDGLIRYSPDWAKNEVPVYYDIKGNIAVTPNIKIDGYEFGGINKGIYLNDFSEGLASFYTGDHSISGCIDKTGNVVFLNKWQRFPHFYFHEGLAPYADIVDGTAKMGYINKKGEVVIPAQFDSIGGVETENSIYGFKEGFAIVAVNGKYGIIKNPLKNQQVSAPTVSSIVAQPIKSKVVVNSKEVAFDAYNIESENYFKLRDLAYSLSGTTKQFDVSWDSNINAINLLSSKVYTITGEEMAKGNGTAKTPVLNKNKILLDNKEIKLTAYNINGNNYFKLRDVGKTFDFAVDWDSVNNTIMIDTLKPYKSEGVALNTTPPDIIENSQNQNGNNQNVTDIETLSAKMPSAFSDYAKLFYEYVKENHVGKEGFLDAEMISIGNGELPVFLLAYSNKIDIFTYNNEFLQIAKTVPNTREGYATEIYIAKSDEENFIITHVLEPSKVITYSDRNLRNPAKNLNFIVYIPATGLQGIRIDVPRDDGSKYLRKTEGTEFDETLSYFNKQLTIKPSSTFGIRTGGVITDRLFEHTYGERLKEYIK